MTNRDHTPVVAPKKASLSLDTWAVAMALALAAIVRLGILPAVKW
jgi:hypothetical protein